MEWRNIQKGKEEILPLFAENTSLIVFDTETTGLGKNDKIIEFSAVKYQIFRNGLKEIDKMDIYINPEQPLKEKIVEITGITDKILEKANPEWIEASNIFSFLEKADLWASYNSNFDIKMLDHMSERTCLSYNKKPTVDILRMARDLIPKSQVENHNLSSIVTYLFPEKHFQYHTSIDDTRAAALIMSRLIGMYKNYCGEDEKRQCRVNWASYSINPNQMSQVRIKLDLSEGEYGDIFWDVVKKTWSCKKTKRAKNLFSSIDMQNIENQIIKRYGYKYSANDMEKLAENWGKYKKVDLGRN